MRGVSPSELPDGLRTGALDQEHRRELRLVVRERGRELRGNAAHIDHERAELPVELGNRQGDLLEVRSRRTERVVQVTLVPARMRVVVD